MILSCQSFAYYNQKQGRWLTRDPLGVKPTSRGGTVSPATQYKDGYNTYEYVRSKPVMKRDAYGLASDDAKVCCKLRRSNTYTPSIPASWPGPTYSTKTTACFQKTHSNPKGFPPRLRCECLYRKSWRRIFGKNTVYGAEEGKCCWCKAYLVVRPIRKTPWQWLKAHMILSFECDDGDELSTDVSGDGRPGSPPWTSRGKLGHVSYRIGKVSCAAARKLEGWTKTCTWKYDTLGSNCGHYVATAYSQVKQECP